ncbi:thiosulfohydrolase SoxB [Alphaproteobacteria bacterium]|nr:thiosulfohydrolase SoxB [Alphaproteobacteria bacterium]
MFDRRDFLQIAAATAVLSTGLGSQAGKAFAQNPFTQDDLLDFETKGQVTLLHITDIHAQIKPVYFREPSVNLGVGEAFGLPPHLVGDDLVKYFGLKAGSPEAYALTYTDFERLAGNYGRVGGMDRVATLVKAIRAQRPNNTLLLDGGDTWHGSFTSLETLGGDMASIMDLLDTDAMASHWEFTLGQERVMELVDQIKPKFLANNIRDTEWEEPVFDGTAYYEKGGVKVAVIGQAFPYCPVANPRYMMADWSFGIREDAVAEAVQDARDNGAKVVVFLSHNGFDVDRKLVSRVDGIDVVLTGHTHDAIPKPLVVNNTLIVGSGSNGKFLSRLDLDVGPDGVKDFSYKLMPVFSDVITPDPEMSALIDSIRAPHEEMLSTVVGHTEDTLYRRGNFNGTFDDVICDALLEQRDAEIALSPGFRWGPTLLPGQAITWDDIYNETAMTYPAAYRLEMTGHFLKEVLEDVADNLFHPDPYFQQGGDMVRVGGMSYTINPDKEIGDRISDIRTLKNDKPLDPERTYVVAGWASVNEGTEGPAIWDVVADHIKGRGTIKLSDVETVRVERS